MEPQEFSSNIIVIYLPGSLYSIIFLLYSWGALFGVPSKVPLLTPAGLQKPTLGAGCLLAGLSLFGVAWALGQCWD